MLNLTSWWFAWKQHAFKIFISTWYARGLTKKYDYKSQRYRRFDLKSQPLDWSAVTFTMSISLQGLTNMNLSCTFAHIYQCDKAWNTCHFRCKCSTRVAEALPLHAVSPLLTPQTPEPSTELDWDCPRKKAPNELCKWYLSDVSQETHRLNGWALEHQNNVHL